MTELIPLAFGVVLGILAVGAAMAVGMHRDRATAPVTLIAIATFYIVFAVEAGAGLVTQTIIASGFVLAALIAFRTTLWIAAVGLALHGIYDLFAHVVDAPAPGWWPGFCLGIDLVFAAAITMWILTGSLQSRPRDGS